MPELTPHQIEAEARRIVRKKLRSFPWHQGCSPEERRRRIEADVDLWWHLEADKAARRLKERLD